MAQKILDDLRADLSDPPLIAAAAAKITECTQRPEYNESHTNQKQSTLKGFGTLFEFACDEDSNLGHVSERYGVKHIRLNKKKIDLMNNHSVEQLLGRVDALPGADAMISIPCTDYCSWHHMHIHKHGNKHKQSLMRRRAKSKTMLLNALRVADRIIELG